MLKPIVPISLKKPVVKMTAQEKKEAFEKKITQLYEHVFDGRYQFDTNKKIKDLNGREKIGLLLVYQNPQFIFKILVYLPVSFWTKLQQVCFLYYKKVIPFLMRKCNSLNQKQIKDFVITKPLEIFRTKLITNIKLLSNEEILVAYNTGHISVFQHTSDSKNLTSKEFKQKFTIKGIEWKRIDVSETVGSTLLLLATDCGEIYLICRQTYKIIDKIDKIQTVLAMCYVGKEFVVMSHQDSFLSCWDFSEQKFNQTSWLHMAHCKAMTKITLSPHTEKSEVMFVGTRGVGFVHVNEFGQLVQSPDYVETFFASKHLTHVGFINEYTYFMCTKTSKQVFMFQRPELEVKSDPEVLELRLIEWTNDYVPLRDEQDSNNWMIGASGTKLYLHNFKQCMSYCLLADTQWNMYTDIQVVRVEIKKKIFIDPPLSKTSSLQSLGIEIHLPSEPEVELVEQKRFIYKIIYSVFDQETHQDLICMSLLDLKMLQINGKALEPIEYTFFNYE